MYCIHVCIYLKIHASLRAKPAVAFLLLFISSTQNYVNICVNNLVEGVLFYRGTRYSAACNPELLQYPDHIQKTKQEITAVYTRLCSENVDVSSDSNQQIGTPEQRWPNKHAADK